MKILKKSLLIIINLNVLSNENNENLINIFRHPVSKKEYKKLYEEILKKKEDLSKEEFFGIKEESENYAKYFFEKKYYINDFDYIKDKIIYLKPTQDKELVKILFRLNNGRKNINFLYYIFIISFYNGLVYEKEKITPIEENNKVYIPLTLEYYENKHKKLSNKQQKIISMIGAYKNTNRSQENYRLLFDEFGKCNRDNKILNISMIILFSIISIIFSFYINKLKFHYSYILLYIFYTFLNLLFLYYIYNSLDLIFNSPNILVFFVIKVFITLLTVFVPIFFGFLFSFIRNTNLPEEEANKYIPELIGTVFTMELIFSIQYLLFWKFYSYPINKKNFDNNIIPEFNKKFSKFKPFLFVKNYSFCSYFTSLTNSHITFIHKSKEKEFHEEIFSL